MNSSIPPDMDRLLWEVAESQDSHAYDDFEKRFPSYVGELGKRIKVVRELRYAGDVSGKHPRPKFDRREPRTLGPSRGVMAGVAFAVCALGFGAYSLTARYLSRTDNGSVQKVDPREVERGVNLPQNTVEYKAPTTAPPAQSSNPGASNDLATQAPPSTSQAPFDRPQTVKLDHVRLKTALLAVAASGGLELEFAPNMPNPDVKIAYEGVSSVDILKDLGAKFGFTAFKEGDRSVLVVPARDPKASALPLATGSGYAVNLDEDTTEALPSGLSQPTNGSQTGAATKPPKRN